MITGRETSTETFAYTLLLVEALQGLVFDFHLIAAEIDKVVPDPVSCRTLQGAKLWSQIMISYTTNNQTAMNEEIGEQLCIG